MRRDGGRQRILRVVLWEPIPVFDLSAFFEDTLASMSHGSSPRRMLRSLSDCCNPCSIIKSQVVSRKKLTSHNRLLFSYSMCLANFFRLTICNLRPYCRTGFTVSRAQCIWQRDTYVMRSAVFIKQTFVKIKMKLSENNNIRYFFFHCIDTFHLYSVRAIFVYRSLTIVREWSRERKKNIAARKKLLKRVVWSFYVYKFKWKQI